jgi:hypothetical protein
VFYARKPDGKSGVFLIAKKRLRELGRGQFTEIGPLGPTINEAGMVAFRGVADWEGQGIPHSANERFLQVEPESRIVWEHLRSRFNLGKRDEERNARSIIGRT